MNLTPEDQMQIKLEIRHRNDIDSVEVQEISISRGRFFLLGRCHVQSDLVLDDEKASRRHIELRLIRHQIWIKDLGSKNGTFLNRKPVIQKPLQAGDIISVGNHIIYVKKITFLTANQISLINIGEATISDGTIPHLLNKLSA